METIIEEFHELIDKRFKPKAILILRIGNLPICGEGKRHRFREFSRKYVCQRCLIVIPKSGIRQVPCNDFPEKVESPDSIIRAPGTGRAKMNPSARRNRTSQLLKRDGNRCHYCRLVFTKEERPTIDHVRPRSKGGTNHIDNLVLACSSCNNGKADEWDGE